MSLVQRSITSAAWNLSASLAKTAILFVRSILLARLLPVDTFGVYALAFAVVTTTSILAQYGTNSAFIHRAPETANVERATGVLFTLRLLLTAAWAAALIALSLLFAEGDLRLALVWLTLAVAGASMTDIPRNLLDRRVEQRRLAIVEVIDAGLSTAAALALAVAGYPLLALLVTDAISLLLSTLALYVWRPIWRPRLLWDRAIAAYYLRFGRAAAADDALNAVLDNVDEVWTGAALGQAALGYYSRAFTFATYPRRVLAAPMQMVSGGTYAELKGDRPRLSRAFSLSNAWLLRGGFLFSGLLLLIAPEFIRLLLGDKWLPMLTAFRLMIVFALLDPIRSSLASLFTAVGRPEQVLPTRLTQLAVLLLAMALLGTRFGINGVAVAVDLMMLTGTVLLLHLARQHADFSVAGLFAAPVAASLVGLAAALGLLALVCGPTGGECGSDWLTAGVKLVAYGSLYSVVLFALERREITRLARVARAALTGQPEVTIG
jgi:O-antigen/teichoic acid export membrane protein